MKYIRDEKALKLLGKRVKELRKTQGVSQEQLAFEAGIDRKRYIRIEQGEINAGVSSLFAIAKALDVPVKELFNF